MTIVSVQYEDSSFSSALVVFDTGRERRVAIPLSSIERKEILTWIYSGNTIAPPAVLGPPTQDDIINNFSDPKAVFIAFVKAYADDRGITFQQAKNRIKTFL